MPGTFHNIHIHYVFSTKYRYHTILPEYEKRLWSYLIGIGDNKDTPVIAVGGVSDHIHMLVAIPPTITISKAIQELKGCSSKWMNDTFFSTTRNFRWQSGYGAFAVSNSKLGNLIQYIHDQKEHHEKFNFKEEYIWLLKKHGMEFDTKYIWG